MRKVKKITALFLLVVLVLVFAFCSGGEDGLVENRNEAIEVIENYKDSSLYRSSEKETIESAVATVIEEINKTITKYKNAVDSLITSAKEQINSATTIELVVEAFNNIKTACDLIKTDEGLQAIENAPSITDIVNAYHTTYYHLRDVFWS